MSPSSDLPKLHPIFNVTICCEALWEKNEKRDSGINFSNCQIIEITNENTLMLTNHWIIHQTHLIEVSSSVCFDKGDNSSGHIVHESIDVLVSRVRIYACWLTFSCRTSMSFQYCGEPHPVSPRNHPPQIQCLQYSHHGTFYPVYVVLAVFHQRGLIRENNVMTLSNTNVSVVAHSVVFLIRNQRVPSLVPVEADVFNDL